ncbi:MAG: Bax inhibitor-1/YccA family protein [Microthrixaceae bacterium]
MSRNPILTDKAFEEAAGGGVATAGGPSPAEEWQNARSMPGQVAAAAPAADAGLATGGRFTPAGPGTHRMTMGGVAAATFIMFAVLLAAAFGGWQTVTVTPAGVNTEGQQVFNATFGSPLLMFGAMFVGVGLAFLTAFKPKLARFTSLAYAACQGFVLGAISAYYGALWQGIVAQAVLATFGVFLVMLVLYGLRVLRATPRFVKGVIAATFGIGFMYFGILILNIFGVADGFWTSGSPLGIIISVVVVCVAALNLILDFDFIERGTQMGLPRYMDWYAGFGLMVTLIWLYLEMLRLLARLRQ